MTPFRLQHLDHVVLRARDSERLARFYCDVLGCTRERDVPAARLLQLRAGASLIDIVAATDRAPGDGNLDHFCLRVEPFDAAAIIAHLARHGIAGRSAAAVYGAEGTGAAVYLDDPEGNTVELKGPSATPHEFADHERDLRGARGREDRANTTP